MKKIIVLNGKAIIYTMERSIQARQIRLSIYPNAEFRVIAPESMNENFVENFIRQKSLWIIKKIEFYKKKVVLLDKNNLTIKNSRIKVKEFAETRLKYYNQFYGFKYNRINIKNHKSRWGSCSYNRNLNFNYRIILLSQELADYIIVHELCHLKEMNHSKNFWELVGKSVPDHKERRRQLKRIIF